MSDQKIILARKTRHIDEQHPNRTVMRSGCFPALDVESLHEIQRVESLYLLGSAMLLERSLFACGLTWLKLTICDKAFLPELRIYGYLLWIGNRAGDNKQASEVNSEFENEEQYLEIGLYLHRVAQTPHPSQEFVDK